jgi:diguanylate cyclase (GGDEF)-like protein
MIWWLALSVALQAQQYVFNSYRQSDGLKNLAVTALARDRQGFLWVGTENGLYRFLGSGFNQYGREQGIAEVSISDVIADPSGTIWAGTDENLYRWDGQRFLPAGRDPIPISYARHMVVEDARHLLIVNKGCLYRLEHDAAGRMISYTPVFSVLMVAAIPELGRIGRVSLVRAQTGSQTVWLQCDKKFLSLPDNRIGSRMVPGDGSITVWDKKVGLTEERWENVLLDRAGTLWIAGQNHVMVLPKGATRFVDRSIPSSDQENAYGHAPLIEDRKGRVLAVSDDGVVRWNGSSWQHIGRANGMPNNPSITSIGFDAAGNLWLGSRGGGLLSWSGYENWEGWIDVQNLPSSSVWSIIPSRTGQIYVGTARGPARIDLRNGLVTPLSAERHWKYGSIASMHVDANGALNLGTFSGAILRIDPKTGRTENAAKIPAYTLSSLDLPDGHTFFATEQGLWERKDNSAPQRIAAVDALLRNSSNVEFYAGCAAPDGAAWFLAENRLLREKNGQWTMPPIDGLPKLKGPQIAISCAADGAVWTTGQQSGTWRFNLNHGRLNALPLALPAVYRTLAPLAILVDHRGWVWLGTDLGLLAWNGRSWRHLTQEDGLIWNDVNQGTLVGAPDGSLWVGTSGGLAHLLNTEHIFDTIPLTASITGIRRENTLYPLAQQITLPWSSMPLSFQIASPSMLNRSELVFKYRMDGLQSEWSEDQDGSVFVSAPPPGDYTFMAMAYNPALNSYSPPVKVHVRILPPWWRTYWFYILCALAFLLLLRTAIRLRVRYLQHRSHYLENLVHERTLELEASQEQLRIKATHDGLTKMFNRVTVLRALEVELDRARRESGTLVVALVDLDHFKIINDSYGHLAGDETIRRFAAAVATAIRPYDLAGRYGGEEFLLILTKIPSDAIEQRLVSLHAAISNLHVSSGAFTFRANCSMGATTLDLSDASANVESLLALADHALYDAKASGRNRVVFQRSSRLSTNKQTRPAQ